MKDQLKRIKELYNYKFDGTITEEMEVSSEFNENKFIEDNEQKIVFLGVGIDSENNIEHQIFLILRFTNVSNYNELVFYFSLVDKNNQFVPGKSRIYDKNVAKKYLPKELQGNIVFFSKLKEMFKKLITMEKPIEFYVETYENYIDEKQLLPYNSIIDLILKNGYMMESKGLSHDKEKYYWKFIQKTKQQIKESKKFEKFINTHKKDAEWWKKFDEENKKIFESSRKRGLFNR